MFNFLQNIHKQPFIFGIFLKKISLGTFLFSSLSILVLPANAYTTDNWNGSWQCDPNVRLTIRGNSRDTQISGYYPDAHGERSAQEIYQINNRTTYSASGTYIYTDSNPRKGPTGVPGVWTGFWQIKLLNNGTLELYRRDDASGWEGTYVCK